MHRSVTRRLIFAALLVFGATTSGCGESKMQASNGLQEPVELQPRVMQMWARSCALCHVDGNAGAPRVGFADEWQSRLAKGQATLLQHTIEGFNDMPPLGYCMACERQDFVDMIDFMTAGATRAVTGSDQ